MPNEAHTEDKKEHKFQIEIDRVHYTVTKPKMTGAELRAVPPTRIGPDLDLFEVVPGGQERKIGDNEVVEIRDGEQFITVARAHKFQIQIDRVHYTVTKAKMTGLELRAVPPTPIGPDRDLFEVVPGGQDRKIGDNEVVEIRDGERFFTAPAHINPGRPRTVR